MHARCAEECRSRDQWTSENGGPGIGERNGANSGCSTSPTVAIITRNFLGAILRLRKLSRNMSRSLAGPNSFFSNWHYRVRLPESCRRAREWRLQSTALNYSWGNTMLCQSIVYIVDDDSEVRELIRALVGSVGLRAKVFATAEDFLDGREAAANSPSCLVVDVFLPGMSGLDLAKRLSEQGAVIPIIMTSAYADVGMAVEAMRSGIVDFLEKPFSRRALVERVQEAIERDTRQLGEKARRADVMARLKALSAREREVMDLLIIGKRTKQIANDFNISTQTAARHRLRVLNKMQVESVAELVHLVLSFAVPQTRGTPDIESCLQ